MVAPLGSSLGFFFEVWILLFLFFDLREEGSLITFNRSAMWFYFHDHDISGIYSVYIAVPIFRTGKVYMSSLKMVLYV